MAMLIGALHVPVTGSILPGVAAPLPAAPLPAGAPGEAPEEAGAADPSAGLAAGATAPGDPAGAALTAGAADVAVWFTFAAHALVITSAAADSPMPSRL